MFKRITISLLGFCSLFVVSARADTYTYDTQGRLTSVTYTSGGSVTYTYDDAGNRTVQTKSP